MKFAKDSIEWGIFGAAWKFYQQYYDSDSRDEMEFMEEAMQAMVDLLEPLKGKKQYGLANGLLNACLNDIDKRLIEKRNDK